MKPFRLEQKGHSTAVLYASDSVALVRDRTIPAERLPLVGEVSAIESVAWSVRRIPTAE
jgi:hypothetical protein